jgi:hypothetical protein
MASRAEYNWKRRLWLTEEFVQLIQMYQWPFKTPIMFEIICVAAWENQSHGKDIRYMYGVTYINWKLMN